MRYALIVICTALLSGCFDSSDKGNAALELQTPAPLPPVTLLSAGLKPEARTLERPPSAPSATALINAALKVPTTL